MAKSVPFTDRAEFWKYQSASIAFDMVRDTCSFLIEHALPKDHPIHDPLVASIYTLYGRPFKQRKPLRLDETIVPNEHRPTHDGLITLRDKMFAHTDLDGPVANDGYLINELAGFTRNASTTFGISFVTPVLPSVRDLAVSLAAEAHSRADAIWQRHMTRERVPDGTSIVNLSPEDGPFLVSHPLLNNHVA